MMQVGYQISSLRAHLTTPEGLLASLRRLRGIGYRHLQMQWVDPAVPLAYTAQALRETGLACIGTQDRFEAVQRDFDYFLQMNLLWRSPSLCVSTIPPALMTSGGLARFAAMLRGMADALRPHGIGLTFHPTMGDYAQVGGMRAMDALMALLPREIGLTLCVLHAVQAGADPVALLARYAGRVEICHLKDIAPFPDGKEYLVPVGQGKIDWPPILAACRQTGVKWCLVEQESAQKDDFECARESWDYVQGIGSAQSG